MRTALTLLLALILPLAARAACDGWATRDTALEAAFTVTVAVDLGQTEYYLRHADGREANPVFGTPRPTAASLQTEALLGVLGHAVVSCLLRGEQRAWWQGLSLGLEGYAVGHNALLVGLRLPF